MTARIPVPLVAKEIRALAPWWLASVLVIAADADAPHYFVLPIGLLAFVTGTLALGAQSLGHEYTNRTLEALLAQPCDRRRVFAIKLLVLLPLVFTLGLVAWFCLTNGGLPPGSFWRAGLFFTLPPVLAVTVAPWMTMMTQSTVAAVVFTAAVPGTFWTLLNVAAIVFGVDDGRRLRGVWIAGVLTLCAAGAALGWQQFRQLQAVDARGIEVMMPRIGRASRARLRHPLWMLFQKELHLQQLTFAVVLLYVTAWAAFALGTRVSGGWDAEISAVLNVLYFTILSLVIGSLASAPERQFGTADSQLLLPVSASRQWAVKAVTAIALAVALGVGIPAVLDRLAPGADTLRLFRGGTLAMVSLIVVLTASSLYVSSLCRSGVAAVVLSFPAIVAGLLIVQTVGWNAFLAAQHQQAHPVYGASMTWAVRAFDLGLIVLLLWLGGRNHRFGEAGFARICGQGLLIATYLAAGAIAIGALAAL